MYLRVVLSSLVLAILVGGCSDPVGPPRIEETEFAAALGIDLAAMTRTASGLYVQDLEVGTGEEAVAGKLVYVHYTGWFPDGTQFDSSLPDKPPIDFVVGASGIIRGFGEGVRGMRVGGQRRLIIPPSLGYGENPPSDQIPKNAILVFVVELVNVE